MGYLFTEPLGKPFIRQTQKLSEDISWWAIAYMPYLGKPCLLNNWSRIFIGKTDAEAETPILWPPDAKNGLLGKDPDAGKVWRREEKGMTEDEMVEWHHWLNGHKFEQALGVGNGQGSLTCRRPWGHQESDRIEQLNWLCLLFVIGCA